VSHAWQVTRRSSAACRYADLRKRWSKGRDGSACCRSRFCEVRAALQPGGGSDRPSTVIRPQMIADVRASVVQLTTYEQFGKRRPTAGLRCAPRPRAPCPRVFARRDRSTGTRRT
jgi:hypothetical protein